MTGCAFLPEDDCPEEPWHIDPRDKDARDEGARQLAALRRAHIICPAVDIVAIPNAGRRSRWEVAQRKREGMKAGALDWVVTWNHGIAFVEWKDGTSQPDDNQRTRLNMYMRWGFHCAVVRREDSFFALLRQWGAPFIDNTAMPIGQIIEPIMAGIVDRMARVNAQTTIGRPAWERYRPALDALKPGCTDEEARYRCGLMVLRDNAQRRLDRDPTGVMRAVWLNASETALQPMDGDQLRNCWGALGQMFLSARRLGDTFASVGGDDACG